jgi:hypothetical protein
MATITELRCLEIWLAPFTPLRMYRRITVSWTEPPQWYPLDLDSSSQAVAMEWVFLPKVLLSMDDVDEKSVPLEIRKAVDPRTREI